MKFKTNLLLCFAILTVGSYASTVTEDIDYQLYKDFATNHGKFKVGTQDIIVPRKSGVNYKLNFPMPDLTSTDSSGVGTLMDNSYIGGVKHNGGYWQVTYGQGAGHTYKLINRKENPNLDQHTPRLNKLVTDVIPSKVVVNPKAEDYSVFVRAGSGVQLTESFSGKKSWISGAYDYLTGGVITAEQMEGWHWRVSDQESFFNEIQGKSPLPTAINAGDSGSPLWGLNKKTGKWELLAFATAVTGRHSIYTPISKEFLDKKIAEDTLKEFTTSGKENIIWGATKEFEEDSIKGKGTISQGNKQLVYNGLKSDTNLNKASADQLNYGKHISFAGENGTIKLEDDINQGAGKIHFKGNYLVTSENKDKTWVGAGIEVDANKKVIWQVNGVEGDALHKVGEGTLYINGKGKNEGDLNIGDGTVILAQEADQENNKQAFNKIDIVSGRGTVVLNDNEQIDTSNINFGFRGGRLDLNGNDISFGDINATDSGAMIINRNSDKKAVANINADKFKKNISLFAGQFGESDRFKPNEKMDVNISSDGAEHKTFAVTGGSYLNGDFNVNRENSTLIFTGERDLHSGENIEKTNINGDFNSRKFVFKNINLGKNTEFQGGIHSVMRGNINTIENNKILLGYIKDQSKFIYDKKQGVWGKDIAEITLNDDSNLGKVTTYFTGDVNLQNNSELKASYVDIKGNINTKNNSTADISNSILSGNIQGDKTSKINLRNSVWFAGKNSSADTISLENGTIVVENSDKTSNINNIDNKGIRIEKLQGKGELVLNLDSQNETPVLNVGSIGEKGTDLNLQLNNSDKLYGKTIPLVAVDKLDGKENIKLTSAGENYIDIGAIRGNITLSETEKPTINLTTDNSISKNTASSLSNVSLSNFAAKTSLIKSQKSLIDDSLTNMNKDSFISGAMYKGNYSDAKYESDKFREYKQTTVNHGVGFEGMTALNGEWDLYKGLSFVYGKSNINYDGDYSGKIETYSGNIYGKIINNDGVYFKGITGVNYLKDEVNSEKSNNYSLTFGAGTGIEKNFSNFNLQMGTDLTLYYLSRDNYSLMDQYRKSYKVENERTYIAEINPQIRVAKAFDLGKKKLSIYSGVGYEYNFYLNGDGAEVKVDGLSGKTGVIENGAEIKVGTEFEFKNMNLGGEIRYLTGKDNSEKFTSSLKATIKF